MDGRSRTSLCFAAPAHPCAMAALAHLTAMDGGNAGDCREQSLPASPSARASCFALPRPSLDSYLVHPWTRRLGHPASLYLVHPWTRRLGHPASLSARASCFALPRPSLDSYLVHPWTRRHWHPASPRCVSPPMRRGRALGRHRAVRVWNRNGYRPGCRPGGPRTRPVGRARPPFLCPFPVWVRPGVTRKTPNPGRSRPGCRRDRARRTASRCRDCSSGVYRCPGGAAGPVAGHRSERVGGHARRDSNVGFRVACYPDPYCRNP